MQVVELFLLLQAFFLLKLFSIFNNGNAQEYLGTFFLAIYFLGCVLPPYILQNSNQ